MSTCLGCLSTTKKLINNYCSTCKKNLFDNITPKPLDFDRSGFMRARAELSDRMSISGVQDKISLTFDSNKLTPTATEGKYILKPVPTTGELANESDIAANEHLSMLISSQVFKIKTAQCGLISFSDGELAYITKRFDYDLDGAKFDQEDFASIMGITSYTDGENYKYDGASYLECALMIKKHVAASGITVEDFFKRILLNYLIANGDAHLKNFSLYSKKDERDYILTPNYDLVNTRYHVNEKYGDMALELLDDYTASFEAVGFYKGADFEEFTKLIGLPQKRYDKIMKEVSKSLPKVEELVSNSFLSPKAKEFYIRIYKERMGRLNL